MLPDVNTDEGNQREKRILVGSGVDTDATSLRVNTLQGYDKTYENSSSRDEKRVE